MKKILNSIQTAALRLRSGLRAWLWFCVLLAAGAGTLALLWAQEAWQPDEPGAPGGAAVTLLDPAEAGELARAAITDPEGYHRLLDQVRTPEHKQALAVVRWGLEHPVEYAAQFGPPVEVDPLLREKAEVAILNPVEATARALDMMSPEEKEEHAGVAEWIEQSTRQP